MDTFLVIWIVVLTFVLLNWVRFFASIARIQTVSDSEVRLRSIFGREYRIGAAAIRKIERWRGFMPRVIVYLKPPRFFYFGLTNFWVPMKEPTPQENDAIDALMVSYPSREHES